MRPNSYDSDFMRYAAQSSDHSATAVTSFLASKLEILSVLDVGCARGTWLRAWIKAGATDIAGVDGSYVERDTLEIPESAFSAQDLGAGFDLARRFDLVQSLEVGEHIPEESADRFVASIAKHARDWIVFSAAPPGQGGALHVNERPYDYWRAKFAGHGYVAVDAIRPAIAGDARVSYWYRYNIVLYASREGLARLPADLRRHVVPENAPIADISPLLFRLRKAVIAFLPRSLQDRIATLKAKALPTGRF
jgi:SAM-dependent methyltransferase